MSFKIQNSLDWVAKALGRSLGPESGGEVPGEVDDGIKATIDALGWDRYRLAFTDNNFPLGPRQDTDATVVPEGEARLIVHAAGSHTDGAASHYLSFQKRYSGAPAPAFVGVPCNASLVAANQEIVLLSPVLLLPGDFLRIHSHDAVGVVLLGLTTGFLTLAIGEYVPQV